MPAFFLALSINFLYHKENAGSKLSALDFRHPVQITTVRVPTKDAALGVKLRQNRSDLDGREDSDAVLQRRDALLSTA